MHSFCLFPPSLALPAAVPRLLVTGSYLDDVHVSRWSISSSENVVRHAELAAAAAAAAVIESSGEVRRGDITAGCTGRTDPERLKQQGAAGEATAQDEGRKDRPLWGFVGHNTGSEQRGETGDRAAGRVSDDATMRYEQDT